MSFILLWRKNKLFWKGGFHSTHFFGRLKFRLLYIKLTRSTQTFKTVTFSWTWRCFVILTFRYSFIGSCLTCINLSQTCVLPKARVEVFAAPTFFTHENAEPENESRVPEFLYMYMYNIVQHASTIFADCVTSLVIHNIIAHCILK